MNPDDGEHSRLWYLTVGPRVRLESVLRYLLSQEVELNPQPIPPGKMRDLGLMTEVLEAVALYRASSEAMAENRSGIQQHVAQALHRAADRIAAVEVR